VNKSETRKSLIE